LYLFALLLYKNIIYIIHLIQVSQIHSIIKHLLLTDSKRNWRSYSATKLRWNCNTQV